jgi:anaerobic C4-dicarboxylate transporter
VLRLLDVREVLKGNQVRPDVPSETLSSPRPARITTSPSSAFTVVSICRLLSVGLSMFDVLVAAKLEPPG